MRRIGLIPLIALAACDLPPAAPPGAVVIPDDPPGDPPDDPPPYGFAPTEARLRRLLSWQYQNTIRDLLGADAAAVVEPPSDVPLNGFISVGAASISFSPTDIEKIERSAFAAAQTANANASAQSWRVCTPTSFDDATCAQQIVEAFGRKAYRRPLDATESARWTTIATSSAAAYGDFDLGIEFAVAGMLQSPSFMYMVEVGAPIAGATDGRRALTGFETATRLSYFFVGSTPSDALLDAAERGDLDTRAGVRLWATQLLGEPGARDALRMFFHEKLGLALLPSLTRPESGLGESLRTSMAEEALRFVDDVVWDRNADARELFSAQYTFANDELAGFYGLPLPGTGAQFARVDTSNTRRAGMLTTGAFLSRYAHERRSSPTLRGKFIRENVMCQAVPAPPDDVDTTLPDAEDDDLPQTTRDRMAVHMSEERCAGCHSMMDPLGFALEEFDQVGRFRTHENGLPVNAATDVDGIAVNGPVELGAALAENTQVTYCLMRNLFRHATGHLEEPGEDPSLALVDVAFEDAGYRLRDALVELAVSDAFLQVKQPEGAQ